MSATGAASASPTGQTYPQPVSPIARCQVCGNMCYTKGIAFYRNVGMLFVRRTHTLKRELCRPCIHKYFWEFTWKNVLLGPWGSISIIVTPIYFLQNTGQYVQALYKLRGNPE